MGTPDEQQPLLRIEPQSMGGEEEPGSSGSPGSPGSPGSITWRKWIPSRKTAKYLGALVVVLLIVAIISLVFIIPHRPSRHRCPGGPSRHEHQNPIDAPPAYNERLEWAPPSLCNPAEKRLHDRFFPLTFDASLPLNITQTLTRQQHDPRGQPIKVWGDLIVRPVEGDATPGVAVEIITNDDVLRDEIDISLAARDEEQALWIGVPVTIPWHDRSQPCVQMRVTLWVPGAASQPELKSLDLYTVGLDVSLLQGLDLKVHSSVSVETMSGGVRAAEGSRLRSRDITIKTISSDIKGSWPLYDSLSFRSASGSVDAIVDLKPAAEDDDASAARLVVSTVSGHVTVAEPLARADSTGKVPSRDYKVTIETVSGDILADLAFGTEARFDSTSGSLDARLLPVVGAGSDGPSNLKTSTVSGGVELQVLEPFWAEILVDDFESLHTEIRKSGLNTYRGNKDEDEDVSWAVYERVIKQAHDALGRLYSRHHSSSGDLHVTYPASWKGMFRAETMSGDISVKGDGVDFEAPDQRFGKTVRGGKGDDRENGSSANLETASGDIHLSVG